MCQLMNRLQLYVIFVTVVKKPQFAAQNVDGIRLITGPLFMNSAR